MPFIRKSKLAALNNELMFLRDWKEVTTEVETAMRAHASHQEEQVDAMFEFIQFLGKNVPDYEGYVLQFLEFKEDGDEQPSGE